MVAENKVRYIIKYDWHTVTVGDLLGLVILSLLEFRNWTNIELRSVYALKKRR